MFLSFFPRRVISQINFSLSISIQPPADVQKNQLDVPPTAPPLPVVEEHPPQPIVQSVVTTSPLQEQNNNLDIPAPPPLSPFIAAENKESKQRESSAVPRAAQLLASKNRLKAPDPSVAFSRKEAKPAGLGGVLNAAMKQMREKSGVDSNDNDGPARPQSLMQ